MTENPVIEMVVERVLSTRDGREAIRKSLSEGEHRLFYQGTWIAWEEVILGLIRRVEEFEGFTYMVASDSFVPEEAIRRAKELAGD